MKYFLDTNIWISGFVARGLCADLIRSLLSQHEFGLISLYASESLRKEFITVMHDKFKATPAQLAEALDVINALPQSPNPKAPISVHIDDPDDIPILTSALAADTDVFITGDQDLLRLKEIDGMVIRSPRQIFEKLSSIE